jgi:hypothetical protein
MTSFSRFAITTALLALGACHAAPAHAGMAAPLPPLPERLARREQLITRLQGDPEARC